MLRNLTSKKWLYILEKFMECNLNLMKKNQKITTYNQLDLETLEFWPIMPKNLPTLMPFYWSAFQNDQPDLIKLLETMNYLYLIPDFLS